jgi:hypothetical protein
MHERIAAAALCLSIVWSARPARAEWTDKDVQRLAEKVKQGKFFLERGDVGPQTFTFNTGIITYVVDVKAQLCFVGHAQGGGAERPVALIPCTALKRGYPLFAPLITWD